MTDDDLNRLVAREVMEFQECSDPGCEGCDAQILAVMENVWAVLREDRDGLFHPATSIADAWKVVEKIRGEGWRWDFGVEESSAWAVPYAEDHVYGYRAEHPEFATAETLPRAICLAVLRAKGVEMEESE